MREQLTNALDHEWIRCGRDRAPLAVLVIRVEGLASFRNASEPETTSNCLKAIVAIIRIFCIRRRDRVLRHGEDGFIALMPNTHSDGANHVANRIANAVRDLQLMPGGMRGGDAATVSVGGAVVVPGDGDSAAGLLQRAEHALEMSRKLGRIHLEGNCPAPAPQHLEISKRFTDPNQNQIKRRGAD